MKTLREREDVEFAYVAWSVPARIICSLKRSINRASYPEVDGQNCLELGVRFWGNRMREFFPESVKLFMCLRQISYIYFAGFSSSCSRAAQFCLYL